MSTGNYDYDNFVRVDCALSPMDFKINAIHEVAHFTLIKQTTYGLLCFFLRQDTRGTRSPLEATLRTLEQGFECVNECYARTKELLLCTQYGSVSPHMQAAILARQKRQSYYFRYHMERLEPLLLQYQALSQSPVFPDSLFLLAAAVDLSPLLRLNLTDARAIQSAILQHPEQLYPDHRLTRLVQAYLQLLQQLPPECITEAKLIQTSGISVVPLSSDTMLSLCTDFQRVFSFRPTLKALLTKNIHRLLQEGYPPLTPEQLAQSFRLSLLDGVIPAALHDRFRRQATTLPAFRIEKNVLTLFLDTEPILSPVPPEKNALQPGLISAFLRFTDTRSGVQYEDVFAPDLARFRPLLDLYPGTIYLYLDDYRQYHANGGFCASPVFFRSDVPWDVLDSELCAQGTAIQRFFLQRYSDSVFFFFGFDRLGHVIFSMLAYWELSKIYEAVRCGRLLRCGASDHERYGRHHWAAFRDLISAVTEDIRYGQLEYAAFQALRIL